MSLWPVFVLVVAMHSLASTQPQPSGLPSPSPSAEPKPEERDPSILSFQGISPLLCTGQYGTHSCMASLHVNSCGNKIEFEWKPLHLAGHTRWEKNHRSWCRILFESENMRFETKLAPARCLRIAKTLSQGLRRLPETKLAETSCGKTSSPYGLLKLEQRWDYAAETKPILLDQLVGLKQNWAAPPAVLVAAEDLASCRLMAFQKNDKRASRRKKKPPPIHIMRCSILPIPVQDWLTSLLAQLGVRLEIKPSFD
ncbi:MAG: hypothetical protein AB1540_14845 [Bdellovibrionota bacterium]